MPIEYDVLNDGHFIHAVAKGVVAGEEFVQFEIDHAIDERIQAPVSELFEIQHGALRRITKDDIVRVLDRRREISERPCPHRCAILVSLNDTHGWDLAMFYEGMVTLHFSESVIVFGDERTARIWLGVGGETVTSKGGSGGEGDGAN
jgi:hypothetical protein